MQSILSVLSKAHCNRAISPEEDLSATELAEVRVAAKLFAIMIKYVTPSILISGFIGLRAVLKRCSIFYTLSS